MLDFYEGGPGGHNRQQRLNPSQTTLCQGAKEKEMFQGFQRQTTRAKYGHPLSKTAKAFSRIRYTMRYPPHQVRHLTIERHQEKRELNRHPVQRTIQKTKLSNTMRLLRPSRRLTHWAKSAETLGSSETKEKPPSLFG